MSTWFGISAPFLSGNKVLERQADERLIKNDLLQLLLTAPGERVMRPTFGAPIRTFVFEQMDINDLTTLKDSIKTAITQFEKRVTVKDILLKQTDDNELTIKILGSLNITQPQDFILELKLPAKQVA